MSDLSPVAWDIDEIFRLAENSPRRMAEILAKYGPAPTPANISMWRSRGGIPGQWLAAIIYAYSQEGFIDDAKALLQDTLFKGKTADAQEQDEGPGRPD